MTTQIIIFTLHSISTTAINIRKSDPLPKKKLRDIVRARDSYYFMASYKMLFNELLFIFLALIIIRFLSKQSWGTFFWQLSLPVDEERSCCNLQHKYSGHYIGEKVKEMSSFLLI